MSLRERLRAWVILGVLIILLRPVVALSHAAPVAMDPPNGAVLPVGPGAIRLQYSQPVELRFSRILLRGAGGREISLPGALRLEGGRVLVQELPALEPGRYEVIWRVLSVDGHVTEGTSLFTISPGAPVPPPVGGLVAEEPGTEVYPTLVLAGAMLAAIVLLRPWRRRHRGERG